MAKNGKAKHYDARNIPEREVLKYVLDFFKYDRNVRLFRRNVGKFNLRDASGHNRLIACAEAGQSDVYGIVKEVRCPKCGVLVGYGQHIEIECKRFGGKLSDKQRQYLELMRSLGAITFVAIPFPTKDDPTGFAELGKRLENTLKPQCSRCAAVNE